MAGALGAVGCRGGVHGGAVVPGHRPDRDSGHEQLEPIQSVCHALSGQRIRQVCGNAHDGLFVPAQPEEYLAAKAAAQRKAAEDRRSLFWRANFLAFLPPAFLLALGSALVWAFGGFRL